MTNTLRDALETDLARLIDRRIHAPGAKGDPAAPLSTRELDAAIDQLRERIDNLYCY